MVLKVLACFFVFGFGFGALTPSAIAHSRWVVPSHTILSGDKPESISLDFSISNDIFHADMAYGGVDIAGLIKKPSDEDAAQKLRFELMNRQLLSTNVEVTYPDGKTDNQLPIVSLGRKSSTAMLLGQSGTYKFSVRQQPTLITGFVKMDGARGREFGRLADVKTLIPKGAKSIKTFRVQSAIETFVTRNNLTTVALTPETQGVSVVHKTHPNELFVGESSEYQLLLNGKPVSEGVEVKITRNDTRYRNQRGEIKGTSDKLGRFTVDWVQAGLYLLEAEITIPSQDEGIDLDIYSLYLTLEVNSE